MTRSEFDRHACFLAVGGVRGSLEWKDFCNMELPVPSIEKQQEIVREYNVISDRIKLNENLNQKLEATAQVIYKHWFVDFEFPISKEYAEEIGKPELEGKPYKSSGGELFYCKELDQEMPKKWKSKFIGELVVPNPESISANDNLNNILYLDTGNITNNKIEKWQSLNFNVDKIPSRARRKVIHNDILYSTVRPNLKHFGILKDPENNAIVSTGFCVLRARDKEIPAEIIYSWIISEDITAYLQAKAEMSVSTYPSIKPEDLLGIKIPFPSNEILKKIKKVFVPIFTKIETNNRVTASLLGMSALIHQKMIKIS